MTSHVEQIFPIIFVEPFQVSDFDNTLVHERHNETIAEPLRQVSQVSRIFITFTDAFVHSNLPAPPTLETPGVYHSLEEEFDVGLYRLLGKVVHF